MSLELNGDSDVVSILQELDHSSHYSSIQFREVVFNQNVISAVVTLFTGSRGSITTQQQQQQQQQNFHQRNWKHIGFYTCSGRVELLVTYIMTLENVQQLTFHDMTKECSEVLGTSLRFNKSVTSLTIRGMLFSENLSPIFGEGLGRNTGLEELDFQSCSFTKDSVKVLYKGLTTNDHLRKLSLGECRLQDEHVALLGKALQKNSSLEELDLSYNRCCSEGLDALATALKFEGTKIRKLSLEHQDIGSSVFDMSTFAEALGENKSLEYLDLSGNHLNNGDMETLSVALPKNSTLATLHLWKNDVTDSGVVCFAQQLSKMNGLKKLYLGDNPFGKDGTRQMLEALDFNDDLEYLGFPHFSWVREMAI